MKRKTLARWLIDKTNTEKYRAGQLSGWKHPKLTATDKLEMGGREDFLAQVRYLEKETEVGRTGRLTFDWTNVNTDITAVHYEVSVIPELCALEQMEDPRAHQLERIGAVRAWRARVEDCSWVCPYYDELLKAHFQVSECCCQTERIHMGTNVQQQGVSTFQSISEDIPGKAVVDSAAVFPVSLCWHDGSGRSGGRRTE